MEENNGFKVGQVILYSNGDRHELGVIKRFSQNGAFVYYHQGDTAANTPFDLMKPIANEYAFDIKRKRVE